MELVSLSIDIISCKNLLIADVTSSDPYVKVDFGKKNVHKTKVIQKTLNPVFSEKTDFNFILNSSVQELKDKGGLEFRVKDYDRLTKSDELGSVKVSAQDLLKRLGEPMEFKLEAPKDRKKGTDAGSIKILVCNAGDSDRKKSLCRNLGISVKEYESSKKRMPVLIVPGIASSGLVIEKSGVDKKYEGKRVWMNTAMLAQGRISRGTLFNSETIEKQKEESQTHLTKGLGDRVQSLSIISHGEEPFKEQEIAEQVRSVWLYHMSLSDDMETEREGNRVRPYEGLKGCEYMTDDLVTQQFATVQAYVTNFLTKELGYVRGLNVDAATYDWRLPPGKTEERDQYLTKMKARIEKMYLDNDHLPIILFCHSMGCKMGHYFLNFAKAKYGQEWLDKYIYSYMPIGAPHCGVSSAVKAVLMGAGLAAPVDVMMKGDDEGVVLYRSFGSPPWLMPRMIPSNVIPSIICRREGEIAVALEGPIRLGTLFRGRDKPKELRLTISYQNHRVHSRFVEIKPDDESFTVEESFYFAVPDLNSEEDSFGLLEFTLEEAAKQLDKSNDGSILVKLSKATDGKVMKEIKRSYIKMNKGLNKSVGAGAKLATGGTGDIYPSEFESCDNGLIKKGIALYHPTYVSNQGKMKIVLKYTRSRIASNETETPIAHIDEALSLPNLPIESTNVKDKHMELTYNYLSGSEMFDKSFVKEKFNRTVKKWYEDDPYGPKTTSALDAPPVKRVNAIYGINLKTEVCAIFRRRPYFVVGDDLADSRYVIDKETKIGKDAILSNHECKAGILSETKNTIQKTIDEDGKEVERAVSGDGTVPYWNLAHAKTWKADLEELTIDEIEGGEHRGILSMPAFHECLRKYCLQKEVF